MKKILILCFLLLSCTPEARVINDTHTIIALGDSITFGYNVETTDSYPAQLQALLEKEGYIYTVTNAGVNGHTSEDLLKRIDTYLADDTKLPTIALLVIGGNDGLQKLDIAVMKKNIEEIIYKLQEKNVIVVLAGMKLPIQFGLLYSKEFGKTFEDIAENTGVLYLGDFLGKVYMDKKYNQDDMIHPTGAGYTLIAQNIFDYLAENNLITK